MALLRHTQFVPHTTRSHHSTALVSILYFPKSLPGILENRKLITVVTFLIIQIARSMSVCDRNRTFLIISSSEFLNQKVKNAFSVATIPGLQFLSPYIQSFAQQLQYKLSSPRSLSVQKGHITYKLLF